MTARGFAPWVGPIAARLRQSRSDIAAFARSAPADVWDRPSANDGWTNKDILAHLATGHWVIQSLIEHVLAGRPFQFYGPDEGNAERIAGRRAVAVSDLIAEVEAEGDETQELLSRLTEAHRDFRREGAPRTFGENLSAFPEHEYHHLDQLRAALGTKV